MSKGEQVDADVDSEVRLERADRRGLNQPIHPEPRKEADVIGDEYMIETQGMNPTEEFAPGFERTRQHMMVGECADS
jgi:hypothetical protein